MNVTPHVSLERIEEADVKLQSQLNKCLNEKRRRQCEIGYLDELAGLISASASDMCSLSVKPDKCAILQETVNQIRRIKLAEEGNSSHDLQQSEVSSSKPNILANDVLGPLLLEALDGFLFMVNTDGKIEFVSENIKSFLKYSQESLIDKSIYNIIHVGDHARFSSNLLPMSIGNGFGWSSEPNAAISKSRSFNCRFLIKPPEDQEETMEEKQTRVSQYENMQIAAVLLPFSGEKSDSSDIDSEIQNHLVCVARRVPVNEKSSTSAVEQFTTRLDLSGRILSIDTSGVSATYSQYLNKDLVGRIIQELCHPNDFQKLNQHLKETIQIGSNTSGIYKLKVAQEKYVQVQTKSKLFHYNPMANEQEFIVATHSIIRDCEPCVESSATTVQSRSETVTQSGTVTPAFSSTMNGNSYPFSSSLSPNEFSLSDIGLDIFPSSSWDLNSSDGHEGTDGSSLSSQLAQATTNASNSSSQRTQPTTSSAFSPELLSGRGSPSTRSPAHLSSTNSPAPGRVTPFTNTFSYSPVQTQSVSRTSSPSPAHIKKEDLTTNNSELSNQSPVGGIMNDNQISNNTTQKLRNLLTHGIEEADSSVSKNSVSDKLDDGVVDKRNYTPCSSADNSSQNDNIILRELLNQEDEDMNGCNDDVNNLQSGLHCNVSRSAEMCSSDMLPKKPQKDNNMLRKLLNNDDDDDKNFRKEQDPLFEQLLKTDGKVTGDLNATASAKNAVANNLSSSVMDVISSVNKRKSPDTPSEDPTCKRQNIQNEQQHAHLAGQNPMLASMLAQTPRTGSSVPVSLANAIVSQLPQDKLPRNLEKKLVHTPCTGTATSGSTSVNNSQYNYNHVSARSLLSTSLQQEVVTADSRGHVTLAPQANNAAVYTKNQGYLSKMLPTVDDSQHVNIQSAGNYGNPFSFNTQQQQQQQQQSSQQLHQPPNVLFSGSLGERNMNMMNTTDPLLSEILDQVWSMEQDMNLETTNSEDLELFKLLEEIPEPAPPVASPRPASTHDVNEKMAINAIQRHLMSFEMPHAPSAPRSTQHFTQSLSVPLGVSQPQLSPNTFSQVNHYQTAPPAYTASTIVSGQNIRSSAMHSIQANNILSNSQQAIQVNNTRQNLPQYNISSLNVSDLPQIKRTLLRQKYLQQHQRRLLIQQKQLSMNPRQALQDGVQPQVTSQFPENMNDLLNTAVAPNVTLQRSASVPEPQLSPRYISGPQMPNSAGPSASSSQLSPGQRQQAYSPLSQQIYANSYPQTRLSPHISPQSNSVQTWLQRNPQGNANLQQQNPMLNAQLSQASFANQMQSRFPNQQQAPRQVRSLPSPGSRNSPYSNPPDSPFHPPSPGVTLYQQPSPNVQQPQQNQPPSQRLQRAVSIPGRVNSPRALQAGYAGNDPILSPQPSPGNYNPPVSSYNSVMNPSPVSYNSDSFGYDQQIYSVANMDRNRNSGSTMTSEFVRQEIRAMVGARTQQQQGLQQQQQLMQSMQQTSQSSNQSLSHADFEALGFSLDVATDGQPLSPSMFQQSLLSVAGNSDMHARTNSPRFQPDEPRNAEPKKSLLQQLLSEPP